MVSLEKTFKKYRGKYAKVYEAKRKPQLRWTLENEIVAVALRNQRGTVLDCPVGTGRFLALYHLLKLVCIGIDSSVDMLVLAKKKKLPGLLLRGNAVQLPLANKSVDHAVCIRFLDLIDEKAMQAAMQELMRVARHSITCTIRFGEKYVPKSNTAEHSKRRYFNLVEKGGWKICKTTKIFDQGWEVLQLKPKEK